MKQLIKSIIPNDIVNKYRILRDQKQKKKNEILFSGNTVLCPICNATYSLFGPYGIPKRENARCHNCRSLERDRLLFLYLNEKLKLFNTTEKKIRLLHFAPEKTFYELFSNNDSIAYTPCDLFPEKYVFDGKIKIAKIDITKIPFEDDSFDFIMCNHVLEHVVEDKLAMSELYRVLSKDGNGIFQVPIDYEREVTYEDSNIISSKDRKKAFGQDDHVRCYGQDYKTRLKDTGFIVNEDNYISKFSDQEILKYGLTPLELIYHCTK